MRDLNYPVKAYRLAEKTIEALNEGRKQSGKSWNLYFVQLLKADKKYRKNDKSQSTN
jgi:hypothetical protein